MSAGFSAGWLQLREPFDRDARETASTALALHSLVRQRGAQGGPLPVVDLACGTGANLRHLAPRLRCSQQWTLVDHDADLLAAVPQRLAAWTRAQGFELAALGDGCRIEGEGWDAEVRLRRLDLARSLDSLPLPPAALVSASALLDLVSATWLERLIARAQPAGAALLFALDVDGRIDWQPALSGDALLGALFGAHQKRDKGFGNPALGSSATAFLRDRLAAASRRCTEARSDWLVDGDTGEPALCMLRALIEGMAGAALEQSASDGPAIGSWKEDRLHCLHQTRLRVGHIDLLCEFP